MQWYIKFLSFAFCEHLSLAYMCPYDTGNVDPDIDPGFDEDVDGVIDLVGDADNEHEAV